MKSRLLRCLGIALLLLAVSPVTAPFSTCDLGQLLGHPPASGTTSVHPKAAADEPAACLGATLVPPSEARRATPEGDGVRGSLPLHTSLHLQLRI